MPTGINGLIHSFACISSLVRAVLITYKKVLVCHEGRFLFLFALPLYLFPFSFFTFSGSLNRISFLYLLWLPCHYYFVVIEQQQEWMSQKCCASFPPFNWEESCLVVVFCLFFVVVSCTTFDLLQGSPFVDSFSY